MAMIDIRLRSRLELDRRQIAEIARRQRAIRLRGVLAAFSAWAEATGRTSVDDFLTQVTTTIDEFRCAVPST